MAKVSDCMIQLATFRMQIQLATYNNSRGTVVLYGIINSTTLFFKT